MDLRYVLCGRRLVTMKSAVDGQVCCDLAFATQFALEEAAVRGPTADAVLQAPVLGRDSIPGDCTGSATAPAMG